MHSAAGYKAMHRPQVLPICPHYNLQVQDKSATIDLQTNLHLIQKAGHDYDICKGLYFALGGPLVRSTLPLEGGYMRLKA